MDSQTVYRRNSRWQYLIAISLVLLVSGISYPFAQWMGYKVVALLLLATVSVTAVLFDIIPVIIAALLSALIWDYFFIPPYFTFQIGSVDDMILLVMYFLIALINAILSHRIRKMERIALEKEEKAHTVALYNTLLNSLSHELRTPIATIIAATDNLQSNQIHLSPEQTNQLVGEIGIAALRLNHQVDNLLNMSRLEAGYIQPRKDWCDLAEIIHGLVGHMEAEGIEQHIHIHINPDTPLFKTDRGLLEQVLHNLLSNAVSYTPPGTRIDILGACIADIITITVSDEGPGFPDTEKEAVFNKFYRLSNSKPGGTGLGLSIARGLTQSLGGSIELSNNHPQGAVFTIRIPAETSYLQNVKHE